MLGLNVVYHFAAVISNVTADSSGIISTSKINVDKAAITASRANSVRLCAKISAFWGGTALESFTIEAHHDRALRVGSIGALGLASSNVELHAPFIVAGKFCSHLPLVEVQALLRGIDFFFKNYCSIALSVDNASLSGSYTVSSASVLSSHVDEAVILGAYSSYKGVVFLDWHSTGCGFKWLKARYLSMTSCLTLPSIVATSNAEESSSVSLNVTFMIWSVWEVFRAVWNSGHIVNSLADLHLIVFEDAGFLAAITLGPFVTTELLTF
jgi:hypothetical protein